MDLTPLTSRCNNWELIYRSFMLNIKSKVGHPFVSNKEGQNHETNGVTLTHLQVLMGVKNKKMMMAKVLVRHSSSWVGHKILN